MVARRHRRRLPRPRPARRPDHGRRQRRRTRRTPSSPAARTRPSSTRRPSRARASTTGRWSRRSRPRRRTASASSASTRRRRSRSTTRARPGGDHRPDAVAGIVAAAQHCPGVISLSFGGRTATRSSQAGILFAVDQGCLVVAAAGNGGLGNPPSTRRRIRTCSPSARPTRTTRSRRSPPVAHASTSPHRASGWSGRCRSRTMRVASRSGSTARASRPRSSARRPPGSGRFGRRSTRRDLPICCGRARGRRIARVRLRERLRHRQHPGRARRAGSGPDPNEPNDDVDQIRPARSSPTAGRG